MKQQIQAQELAASLLNHLEAMVAYWDKDERCRYANNAYLQWFEVAHEKIMGMSLQELLGPALYEKNLPYLKHAYSGKLQVFERTLRMPKGKFRYSLVSYIPHVVDGKVQGIFVHVADVTPLKQLENKLRLAKVKAEKMATHDFLTGLPNRVLLNDRIEQVIAQAKRSERMIAGASLDLDDFKRINDTLGHAAGDKLLVEIAARIKKSVRVQDTVTRLGGDEFFLLFGKISGKLQVESIADRVLSTVRMPVEISGQVFHPSCSLGIVMSTDSKVTPDMLIDESDKALYEAKANGKNRYALWQLP